MLLPLMSFFFFLYEYVCVFVSFLFFFFFLDTQSGMERILISKFHSLRIPTDANENIFLDIPGKIR